MTVQNPFVTERAARLYAAGRPDYSEVAGALVRRLTGITEPVAIALDVGPGTGISTKAIAPSSWLLVQTRSFFDDDAVRSFVFRGYVATLRRSA